MTLGAYTLSCQISEYVLELTCEHFDLVSERDVRQAREHLAAEIAPLLRELILRAENVLNRNERRARALRNEAAQALAHVDLRSHAPHDGGDGETDSNPLSSPSVTALMAEAQLDDRQRTLLQLQEKRKRLMVRVQALGNTGYTPESTGKAA